MEQGEATPEVRQGICSQSHLATRGRAHLEQDNSHSLSAPHCGWVKPQEHLLFKNPHLN